MAVTTLNDLDVIALTLHEPRVGLWHADVSVDTEEDITGAAVISAEGGAVVWTGTVIRGGIDGGHWAGRIVGGAAGLRSVVGPKYYRNIPLRLMVTELLDEIDEELDEETSDAVALDGTRARWQRIEARAAVALTTMLEPLSGHAWRLTREGKLVIVADAYAEVDLAAEVIENDPVTGAVTIAPIAGPTLVPGVTVNGDRVDYVLTSLSSDGLRQYYWRAAA